MHLTFRDRRWPTTDTFNLPRVEVGITPLDFYNEYDMAVRKGDLIDYDATYKKNEFLQETFSLLKKHIKCFCVKSSSYVKTGEGRGLIHILIQLDEGYYSWRT